MIYLNITENIVYMIISHATFASVLGVGTGQGQPGMCLLSLVLFATL